MITWLFYLIINGLNGCVTGSEEIVKSGEKYP